MEKLFTIAWLAFQVLQNLQNYLQTEDIKMQEAAEASAKKSKHVSFRQDSISCENAIKRHIEFP